MFSEPLEFIGAVVHFWADWSTGGVLVLAIALVRLLKSKDFRKKTWLIFFIFFLLMGFFSAWENQKQKRIAAETNSDSHIRLADYDQKRIDKLSDALTIENATNKSLNETISAQNNQLIYLKNIQASNIMLNANYSGTQINQSSNVSIKSDLENSPISIEGDNNGNVANVQNSPNAKVDQSVINQSPPPYIAATHLNSINVPDLYNGLHVYKTQFTLKIGNIQANVPFYIGAQPFHAILVSKPTFVCVGSDLAMANMGMISFNEYQITFCTFEKVHESDFGTFTVKNEP